MKTDRLPFPVARKKVPWNASERQRQPSDVCILPNGFGTFPRVVWHRVTSPSNFRQARNTNLLSSSSYRPLSGTEMVQPQVTTLVTTVPVRRRFELVTELTTVKFSKATVFDRWVPVHCVQPIFVVMMLLSRQLSNCGLESIGYGSGHVLHFLIFFHFQTNRTGSEKMTRAEKWKTRSRPAKPTPLPMYFWVVIA